MADYSGAYDKSTPQDYEIAGLKQQVRALTAELKEYQRKDVAEQMKRLGYGTSPIEYHVECNRCFAAVREVNMSGHRDRCK